MSIPVSAPPAPFDYAARTLASERLELEAIAPGHADLVFDELADPALYTYLGPAPVDAAAMRARFTRIANPHAPTGELWLNYAVRERETGRYVGYMQATVKPDRTAYLAYFVFRRAQRRGIAREACAAVLAHLWHDCAVTTVRIEVDTRNQPSQRLAEALGLARVGGASPTDPVHGAPAWDYVYRLDRPAPGARSA